MKLLVSTLESRRSLLVGATLLGALGGLGTTSLVVWINRAISAQARELPWLGLQFVAIAIGAFGCRALSQCGFVELSQTLLGALRLEVGTHVARAPYRDVERHGAARLLTVLTEDIASVSDLFVVVPRVVMYGAVLLACVAYLAVLSWQATLVATLGVLVGAALERHSGRAAREHLSRARLAEEEVVGHFRALFDGAKELRLSQVRRHTFLADVLAKSVERAGEERAQGSIVHGRMGSQRVLVFHLVVGGVIFWLRPALSLGPEVSSGYALMYLYMMLPLQALVDAAVVVARAQVALGRIEAVGVGAHSGARESVTAAEQSFRGLRLCEVTHSYRRDGEDGAFVLGPVSLELKPSEIVLLIGGNGSGKTTLAKLIAGLYAPETGQVLLNGARVDDAGREAYRQQISAVFSDFHLFDGLIGIERHERDERASVLLQSLDLAHKVQIRDGKFSTTALSAGQRKRLALLVSCLEDRPVCIFDEWAADQDSTYRDVFYRQILPELKARGKALLVITHDDSYFHVADRCFELEAGRLRARPARALAPPIPHAFTEHEPAASVLDEAASGNP